MKSVTIDRSKHLGDEPRTGHNRWHPEIAPIVEADEGEEVTSAIGMPVDDQGGNEDGNLNLACRNAVLNMIALLQERGFSREQAYVSCSVAVDLRINNVVDVPNFVVSAYLPEHIFQR
jgi:formamidase